MNNYKLFSTFDIEITIITPIHIGTGGDYFPVDYVIRPGSSGEAYFLHFINREKFIDLLIKRKRFDAFLEVSKNSSFNYINKFIHDNFEDSATEYKIPVSKSVYDIYSKNIKGETGGHERNRLEIMPFIKDGFLNDIYIPGSSIKGAVRTAVLNQLIKEEGKGYKDTKALNIEKHLLKISQRDTSDDPFRLIKISDFTADHAEGPFSFVDKVSNTSDSEGKLSVFMELSKRKRVFKGTISIFSPSKDGSPISPGIQKIIDIDYILKACNYHYTESTYNFESDYFKNVYSNSKDLVEEFKSAKNEIKENGNSFLLKIGRHSGAYAVTMDGYRNGNIKLRHRKGAGGVPATENADHQTTTWYSESAKMPIGWIKCRIVR